MTSQPASFSIRALAVESAERSAYGAGGDVGNLIGHEIRRRFRLLLNGIEVTLQFLAHDVQQRHVGGSEGGAGSREEGGNSECSHAI